MNKVITWILVAVVVLIVLVLIAVLPVRRTAEEPATPSPVIPLATLTPLPTISPPPSPEALTPEKEQLTDFEAAEGELTLQSDVDAGLQQLDSEIRGL